MSLNVALLGSGIFVREAHKPAVEACKHLNLVAVYSRTRISAENLLAGDNVASLTTEALGGDRQPVEIYSEDTEGKGLRDLLARQDVHLVIIALPITVQGSIVRQCLLAGKHVLSEKPVARDQAEAKELIEWYEENFPRGMPIWAVAENYRFMEHLRYGRKKITQLGRVLGFCANFHGYVHVGGKYFETAWRKVPDYQGGFLLGGGVHQTAALQLLLGDDNPIVRLSAFTNQNQPHLPPKDTISATVKLADGTVGYFNSSFGTTLDNQEIVVACENGSVSIVPGKVTVKNIKQNVLEVKEFPEDDNGVHQEVAAFAQAIVNHTPDQRQSPRLAWNDLELIEKMLVSGERDGEPIAVTRCRDSFT